MDKGNSCRRSVDQVREQMEQAQEEGDEIIGINSKSYFRASRRSRRIDPGLSSHLLSEFVITIGS
jgi:hypothetical protein